MSSASPEIHLLPQQVVLKRPRRLFPYSKAESTKAETEINSSEDPMTVSIAAGVWLLDQVHHSGNLRITFSDLWVRYDLIQLGDADVSDDEATLLARTHFSNLYPDAGSDSWPLRLARIGQQLLVAAVNPALQDALKQIHTSSNRLCILAEPLFTRVLDRYTRDLSRYEGWILVDEPGMLLVAYFERGNLLSLQSQRCDNEREITAHLLLERQAALLTRPAGEVRIFSYSGSPIKLRSPWRCSQSHSLATELHTASIISRISGAAPTLNFAIEQRSLIQRRLALGIALLITGALALGFAAFDYHQQTKNNTALLDRSATIHRNIQRSPTETSLPPEMKAAILRANNSYELITTPWEKIFHGLEIARNKVSANIALLSVSADSTKRELTLSGEAKDFTTLSAFSAALTSSPLFQDVSLSNDKLRENAFPIIVTFDLRLTWHEPDFTTD